MIFKNHTFFDLTHKIFITGKVQEVQEIFAKHLATFSVYSTSKVTENILVN